jgi:hypothetical protein
MEPEKVDWRYLLQARMSPQKPAVPSPVQGFLIVGGMGSSVNQS